MAAVATWVANSALVMNGTSTATRVSSETIDADGVSTLEVDLTAQRWQELRSEGLPATSIRQKV